jgi:hypothetical protein
VAPGPTTTRSFAASTSIVSNAAIDTTMSSPSACESNECPPDWSVTRRPAAAPA